MQRRIVLWLIPGQAQAIIKCQIAPDLPGILYELFHVPIAVQSGRIVARLTERVEDSEQGIRKAEASVEWIARIVAKVIVTVEVRKGALVFGAALQVNTGLDKDRKSTRLNSSRVEMSYAVI